ncbi:VOC family protein [Streptomyces sp. t39]|uniref:VOC family protein n=1 Tax=Streptomyces sp. t39 TaxID=1828156 RepID=UPI0011CE7AE1|nr:VOC family protein [Streptomyces sp. t39]TXS35319.1 4a-hydroxytetrahydrobiopterin dehydratase [Streptomyces sp. t39]
MSDDEALTRQAASDAVGHLGWRYLLGTLRTAVPVASLDRAAEAVRIAVEACGHDADGHLVADLRSGQAALTLRCARAAAVTCRDTELARRITAALGAAGLRTEPGGADAPRSVQLLELAIDALDIAAIRPFWKAVLGYADEADADGSADAVVDPLGQGPAVWFQQMDVERPQRNRIHFDLCVPHDEADARIAAALAAGGRLVSADRAPAFTVLADAEGNEVCVTTWQGRDG